MATPHPTRAAPSVVLRRVFPAPRERVFKAWTDPEELRRWFGPAGVDTLAAEIDLRVGGAYRTIMRTAAGERVEHFGVYRDIRPNEKLVFTWVLDGQGCAGSRDARAETLVTVEFRDLGAATEVVLTHEFLPHEQSRAGHSLGWRSSFDCLAGYLP